VKNTDRFQEKLPAGGVGDMHSYSSKLHPVQPMQKSAAVAPVTFIRASRNLLHIDLGELWSYRELLYFLIWRDVKIRYKQTAIGAAWAILQPLLTMLMFTVIFSNIAHLPSDGVPYPIFSFTALLPWNLFAGALNRSVASLVGQANLISKVYFPKLLVPFSASFSGFVDFAISLVFLAAMMIWFRIVPPLHNLLLLPLFALLAVCAALAVGIWLSAFNVKYRDVGHAIPFVVQLWMFASPVAYSTSLVPKQWRFLYGLNPMTGVIEGFRWALLGRQQPDFAAISVSAVVVVVLLFGGIVYFKRMEDTFADIV
jgi:lipopolysaccharide transport system permease protein